MAEKRMFARKIIDSDAFLEMPLSAQALYFHLNMRADDDGFVNNPKRITDYVNASVDDLKILLTKRFVIGFESGGKSTTLSKATGIALPTIRKSLQGS